MLRAAIPCQPNEGACGGAHPVAGNHRVVAATIEVCPNTHCFIDTTAGTVE